MFFNGEIIQMMLACILNVIQLYTSTHSNLNTSLLRKKTSPKIHAKILYFVEQTKNVWFVG